MLKLAGFPFSATMEFAKPPLSYADQAALLIERGLVVSYSNVLMRQLEAVGYYRLCAYWHPFKQADSSFVPGTSFDVVWNRYVFDRQLRLAVMDAIERVEIAVRTALVTELAMRHGAFAHVDPKNFPSVHPARHARFLEELRSEAQRSRERFVDHFKTTYDEFPDLPIWAAVETMTFGSMFTLFAMSEKKVQKNVARKYGIAGPVLYSWLQTLNYVRNICAHHARLWNRELAIRPTVPDVKNGPEWHRPQSIDTNRMFVVLTILRFLLHRVAPQSAWRERLFAQFDRFPDVPLASMGMDAGWRQHTLWR